MDGAHDGQGSQMNTFLFLIFFLILHVKTTPVGRVEFIEKMRRIFDDPASNIETESVPGMLNDEIIPRPKRITNPIVSDGRIVRTPCLCTVEHFDQIPKVYEPRRKMYSPISTF